MTTLNCILEGYQAEEMAKDMNLTAEEAALSYFNDIAGDCEIEDEDIPVYSRFVRSGNGISLYYDFGADYYFAAVS